jgi:hypothetical protein
MPRPETRKWKRGVAAATRPGADEAIQAAARESALSLLARSVAMRHHRLAVQRLLAALKVEANVAAEHWAYCRDVASRSADEDVRAAFSEALLHHLK